MIYNKNNLSILSKYRNELFGIAVIGILMVHAKSEFFPFGNINIINTLLGYGGIGVDMFLFLSGIGLYFSLRNDNNLKRFYYKRIARVVIPYLIIGGLFYFWLYFIVDFRPMEFFYELSLVSFWIEHKGAWYVAMIIPVYILFPFLYHVMENTKSRKILTVLLVSVSISVALVINITLPYLYNHLINVLVGIPVFIIGCYCGESVYNQKSIPVAILLIFFFLLPMKSFFDLGEMNIIIGLSYSFFAVAACVVFAVFLDLFNCKKINDILSFIGNISLEMYLFNIYLIQIFGHYIKNGLINSFSDYYHAVGFYSLIILFGITLSYLFHKLNNWIAAWIFENGKFNHGRISSLGQ